jgi:hypothetical protein
MKRTLSAVLALGVTVLVAASSASASSIVYIKDGDIWLTSPDGSKRYQVTTDGHYFSPSQADNGMIVAGHGSTIVRMDRSGQLLGPPVAVVGGDTTTGGSSPADKFYGPMDPKVSPDGTQVAYWLWEYANYYSAACNCIRYGLQNYTTTTAIDHLTSSPQDTIEEDRDPSWIDNHRTLVWDPYFLYQASTWVPGSDWHNRQWWFQYPDAMLRDGELSPDGRKLVAIAAIGGAGSPYDHLYFWSTNGPAWTGEPPYNEDINNDPRVPAPTIHCENVRDSDAASPSWSPDSTAIAYQDKDGIWIQQVPADLGDCSASSETLLVPGGSDPDWGPADVDMSQRPGLWQAPATPPPPATVTLTGLKITPRAFRAARRGPAVSIRGRGTVRFTLSAAAPVTFSVQRGRRVRGRFGVAGRAGANVVRLTGRVGGRRLAVGRYRLVASAGQAVSSIAFRVTR